MQTMLIEQAVSVLRSRHLDIHFCPVGMGFIQPAGKRGQHYSECCACAYRSH